MPAINAMTSAAKAREASGARKTCGTSVAMPTAIPVLSGYLANSDGSRGNSSRAVLTMAIYKAPASIHLARVTWKPMTRLEPQPESGHESGTADTQSLACEFAGRITDPREDAVPLWR